MPPFDRNLRCLTLRQPWASLLAGGAKRNETRGWQTSYRGLVAIHASSNMTDEEKALCLRQPFVDGLVNCGYEIIEDLPLGRFIAIGMLDAITPTSMFRIDPNAPRSRAEYQFGNFSAGRFVWHFNDMRAFPLNKQVPAKGTQSLWTPGDDLHRQLIETFLSLAAKSVSSAPDHLQL